MYDFKIKEMLEAFDNNPQSLIEAFEDAVNTEMANQTAENEPSIDENILIAATDVANLWYDYIHFYFNLKELHDTFNIDEFIIEPKNVIKFTESLLIAVPLINQFKKSLEEPTEDTENNNDIG